MWAWMFTEKAFMSNALQGIASALLFSFLVLLLYTRAIIQTMLAIASVSFIMVSVICIMVLNGWEMGISESAGLVLLIGLSVDYVVHLAAHFSQRVDQSIEERIKSAYHEISMSITSAAFTTLGCGIFLLGGKNLVFKKFAVLICSTILFSWIIAMTVFGLFSYHAGKWQERAKKWCCSDPSEIQK